MKCIQARVFLYRQICAQAMPHCTPRNISMGMYGRCLCGIYENRINYQLTVFRRLGGSLPKAFKFNRMFLVIREESS